MRTEFDLDTGREHAVLGTNYPIRETMGKETTMQLDEIVFALGRDGIEVEAQDLMKILSVTNNNGTLFDISRKLK